MVKAKKSPADKPEKATAGFQPIQGLFTDYAIEDKGGYITQEFQDFGYRLAMELDDQKHKSLYMRLSKNTPRIILERALSFVTDAPNVKSKAKLFMWKLQQLKTENKEK
jgi:hypothetical protein